MTSFQDTPWRHWGVMDESPNLIVDGDKYACEIEVETEDYGGSEPMYNTLRTTPANKWRIVEEGSLRGGYELVSLCPMPKDQLKMSLAQVAPAFSTIRDTFRAAVHVHCNVQHFTREDYMRAVVAYYVLEPEFFAFAGKGRDESVFCVPWAKASGHVQQLALAYHNEDAVAWGRAITNSPKYAGLNLRATSVYGSIEFRHMPTPASHAGISLPLIAEFIDMCDRVIFLATSHRVRTKSLLEFADYVITTAADNVPMEHLCNVYSMLAIERPMDRLSEGISSATVLNTVNTYRAPSIRRRSTSARHVEPRVFLRETPEVVSLDEYIFLAQDEADHQLSNEELDAALADARSFIRSTIASAEEA
jgi:hypothetical protein